MRSAAAEPAPTAPPARWVCSLLMFGVLLVLVGCSGAPSTGAVRSDADPVGYRGGVAVPEAYVMPPVAMTDTAGQAYDLASSPSRPVTLLFFGYTSCPDVCIAVLSDIALALRRLTPQDRDQIQVVFITTDPARDTPAKIRKYLDRFNPDFIGLTSTLPEIKAVADRVGVSIGGAKRLASGGYDVGHSAQVIGFSRARGVVVWTQGTPVGALVHDFGLLVVRSR